MNCVGRVLVNCQRRATSSPLFGSVSGEGSQRALCCHLFWGFAGEEAVSQPSTVSQHIPFCICTTGALPAIALVLIQEWVGLGRPKSVGSLLEESPKNLAVSSATPSPADIYSQNLWGFIFLAWNSRLCGLAQGWDSSFLRYPSQLLSTTWVCGTTISATCPSHVSALLCSCWSLCPSNLLDEYGFCMSIIVRCQYHSIF